MGADMNPRFSRGKVRSTRAAVARTAISLLAASAVAGLGLSATPAEGASTPGDSTGVTSSTVTLGQVDTLSGPVPGLFLGAKYGTQAYINYINSQGGVNGRKLKLIVDDDQFSGANYATDTQSLVKQTFALVGGFSLFDASGVPAINANKVPTVALSLSDALNLDRYNYSPQPLIPGSSILGPLKYYKQKYGSAIKHVGTIDTSVATAETQTNDVLAAAKSIGYKVTYLRTAGPVETDFTSDVLKMKAAGVQTVYLAGLAVGQVASLAKEMAQQDFHPKVLDSLSAYDSSYIPQAGAAANGTSDAIVTALYLGQDAKSVPAVALFDKWMKKVNPSGKIDTFAFYGWTSAQLFVQALRAAGSNPTCSSVLAQLDKITSFNGDGIQATSDPAQKRPASCWVLVKVVNGKWQRVSPSPKTGYVCNPGGYYYPPGTKPFQRIPPPTA